MQLVTNVLLLVEAFAFTVVAFAAGDVAIRCAAAVIRRAGHPPIADEHEQPVAVSLLVGYGVCAFAGMVIALAHFFYWWVLLALALAVLAVARRRLAAAVPQLHPRRDALWLTGLLVVVVQLGAMFLAALAPPTAFDELAYHLPEARIVVSTHALPLNLGGHYFFGNIPKLFEILFAEGIALHGYALAHVLHAAVFAAFVWTAYAVIRDLYGPRTAILASTLVATLPTASANAESMQIDTGTTSFEIGALLLILAWLGRRDAGQLAAAALLAGFALSGKYSSAPTVFFVLALLGIVVVRSRERRRLLSAMAAAVALAVVVAGFWYAKNAVRFGNPFYPLYLGHTGVSEEEYSSLLGAIRQFGPRTLDAFLHIPARFPAPIDVPAFLAFAIAPFALLVRKRRAVSAALGAYFVLYIPYWFFIASHQIRFLFAGLFVAAIAAAVVVAAGGKVIRVAAATAAAAAFVTLHPSGTITMHNLGLDVREKLGADTIRYAIGAESQDDVLARVFGCPYRVVRYLPSRDLTSGVVDNWSQWFGYNLDLYKANEFTPLPRNARQIGFAELARHLRGQGFRYLYFEQSDKDGFAASTDPIIRRWWLNRRAADAYLLRTAQLVYRNGDCSLYRLAGS